ncbi:Panacea domain-containing protein [Nonomuraea dietziae]|uniref:Panacea domain-containing protein n=1 Tax=Nonomuraea dietziae TaxID=65515 RepID=UPI003438A6AA
MSVATEYRPASYTLYDALLALLKVARERRVTISRKKAAKLLYLADTKAVSDGGEPISGATWKWQDYGPFDNAWYEAEDALVWTGSVERHDTRADLAFYRSVRLTLAEDVDDPLPAQAMRILHEVVAEHGHKSANKLQALSYATEPMIEAQAGGERGVLLNLDQARKARRARALIERHRAMRAELQQLPDDPGVSADLDAEFAEFGALRRRANTEELGDA